MTKYYILFVLTCSIVAGVHCQVGAQKQKQQNSFWTSTGFAHHRSLHTISSALPSRTFALTHQNEYHLLTIGYQARLNLVAYISLEYNTFAFHTDFSSFSKDPNARSSSNNRPYGLNETIFLQETQQSKLQGVLVPSFAIERRVHVYNKLHLSFGARISKYKGKLEHFYQGSWGYGGNGFDRFERVEINTLESTKEYEGGKIAAYLVPEWRLGAWTIGATFGFQYKCSTPMLVGQSVVHKSHKIDRNQRFAYSQEEIGLLSGFRITHETTIRAKRR